MDVLKDDLNLLNNSMLLSLSEEAHGRCINIASTFWFLLTQFRADLEELTDLERFVQELEPVALASWKGLRLAQASTPVLKR